MYNGRAFEPYLLNSLAYVEQHVPLYKTLTIREIVLYSAYLRIPGSANDCALIENEAGFVTKRRWYR